VLIRPGVRSRTCRTACLVLQLQSEKTTVTATEASGELNWVTTMTVPRSLTAACSTVELLRNGSLEF
jgi:hypothetical protein